MVRDPSARSIQCSVCEEDFMTSVRQHLDSPELFVCPKCQQKAREEQEPDDFIVCTVCDEKIDVGSTKYPEYPEFFVCRTIFSYFGLDCILIHYLLRVSNKKQHQRL